MKKVLQEGALVAVIGAALAFAANALAPHGLKLGTDYYPGDRQAAASLTAGTNVTGRPAPGTNSPQELLAARLRADGLQLADSNQVVQLFRSPGRELDQVVFIDSRNEEHYRAGHIPGAYLFDRYEDLSRATNVIPVCLVAQQIVFYCNGGDCDDSEHAALMLRDSVGIPKEKVYVYGGGLTEWVTNGLPVELGARNSGQFTNVVHTAAGTNTGVAKP